MKKKYTLYAVVGVSAVARVEAESLKEAIEIAKDWPAVMHFDGSGTDIEDDLWLVEEIDGVPTQIHGAEDK